MLVITIIRIIVTIVVTKMCWWMYEAVVHPNKDYEQFYAAHHKTSKEDE